jgi:hypothetical protein
MLSDFRPTNPSATSYRAGEQGMLREEASILGRCWRGKFAILLDNTGRILVDEANRQFGVQVPGLIRGSGRHGELRLVPAPGQIEEIGCEDGGLKEVFVLTDGGHHEFPPGGLVFYLME